MTIIDWIASPARTAHSLPWLSPISQGLRGRKANWAWDSSQPRVQLQVKRSSFRLRLVARGALRARLKEADDSRIRHTLPETPAMP
jgi:hypothetical protein